MATRVPLVIVAGEVQQLQSGDQIVVQTAQIDVRIVTNGEASVALVIGAPVYVFGAGSVKRAQGNALSTSKVLGLWVDPSTAAAATGQVGLNGLLTATTTQWDAVTGQTGGLTSGAIYYVDPVTAGKLTSTAPSTVGQVVAPVGIALSTTDFEINEGLRVLL